LSSWAIGNFFDGFSNFMIECMALICAMFFVSILLFLLIYFSGEDLNDITEIIRDILFLGGKENG